MRGEGNNSGLVPLDLFVASKCPDAARCETSFLPEVLRQVSGGFMEWGIWVGKHVL